MELDITADGSPDATDERALVARARVDPAAFAELYDRYLPRVFGFVARRVGDRAAAEDVTAVTFERALTAVRDGDFRDDSFGGWLHRVAASAAADHVRRSRQAAPPNGRRATDTDLGALDEALNPGDERAERTFSAALDGAPLRRALDGLTDAQRRVIVLRFLDGLDGDALAVALGCTRRTASVRLHRALRAMRAATASEDTGAA